jgi:antitoxin (DNA-binding transcriptional repressor) of toxin-antitoxin stability system
MVTVTLEEITQDLSRYLHRTQAGETFVILQNGTAIAEIRLTSIPHLSRNLENYADRARQWDSIPDTIAAQLKAEFATEDQAFAEAAIENCADLLHEVAQ